MQDRRTGPGYPACMTTTSSSTPADSAGAPWQILATKGCGSALVEAALALAEIPYQRHEVDYSSPEGRARIAEHNPLGQVPTVILPGGQVMSESAALVLHIDGLRPQAGLLPPPGDPQRPEALRWLLFLVAAVYPTFTYGDEPAKWVGAGDAADALRRSTDEHRTALWRQVEAAARAPWFLGPRLSALDVYLAVMTHWRPGWSWFADTCPRIAAIAAALDRDPRLAQVWADNDFAPR